MNLTKLNYELKIKELILIYTLLVSVSLLLREFFVLDSHKIKLYNQGFISSFFGLWSVFIYKEFFNDNLKDLLYSYPINTVDIGAKKILSLLAITWLFLMPLIFLEENIYSSILLYFPQTTFLIGLGFLLITSTKNFELSASFLLVYISTEFFTRGKFFNWPHIFVQEEHLMEQSDYLVNMASNTLFFSILFVYLGHLLLLIDKRK